MSWMYYDFSHLYAIFVYLCKIFLQKNAERKQPYNQFVPPLMPCSTVKQTDMLAGNISLRQW